MKKALLLIFLFSQIYFGQANNTAEKVFEIANEMYKKGDYENAIQKYEFIEKNIKQQSAELYFNLGNCYYKLNKIAPSIYYYEKALLLHPGDNAIETNLKFAQKRTIDNIKTTNEFAIAKFIRTTTAHFSVSSYTWFSIIFSILTLVSFILFLYHSSATIKRISFSAMFVFILLGVLCFFAAHFFTQFATKDKAAIVFEDSIEVKSEPKEDAETAFTLHEGTKVYVKETLENYNRIQLADKTEGWILSTAIKEIR